MVSFRSNLGIPDSGGVGVIPVIGAGRIALLFIVAILDCGFGSARGLDTNSVIAAWLGAQSNLISWQAEFTQTRDLKALTHPLTSDGKVWFQSPDSFRWELGNPVQTVALRQGSELTLLVPRLRRAEKHALTEGTPGPMRDAWGLFDAGFPRDAREFHQRFEVLGIVESEIRWWIRLRPKSRGARKFLPELGIGLAKADYSLVSTELRFADGSRLKNDFRNAVRNPRLASGIFTAELDSSWKVTGGGNEKTGGK